jgi:hypothetical protein
MVSDREEKNRMVVCAGCGAEVDRERWFCPRCRGPVRPDEGIYVPGVEKPAKEQAGPTRKEISIGSAATGGEPGESPRLHSRLRKSLLIRILITLLILAILIAAVLLISWVRRDRGKVVILQRPTRDRLAGALAGAGPTNTEERPDGGAGRG